MFSVSELMSRKIVTVQLDDSLRTVEALFTKHGFHHVMVVEDNKLVGVLSDRDLLRNLSPFLGHYLQRPQDLRTLRTHVHQVMTRKLVTVVADTSIADATALLIRENVSCLPVVASDQRPVGILTWRDLLVHYSAA